MMCNNPTCIEDVKRPNAKYCSGDCKAKVEQRKKSANLRKILPTKNKIFTGVDKI